MPVALLSTEENPNINSHSVRTMTTKQVKAVAPVAANSIPQNLFISVRTFDAEGKTVGERIVDMCHYGTRDWLSKHLWWATHNGHCTEVDLAKPPEIEAYLEQGKLALASKFNSVTTDEIDHLKEKGAGDAPEDQKIAAVA